MADEGKKPGAEKKSGPVVIRKGHVKPPPPGAKIETPVVEVIAPVGDEKPDDRPLWQRAADLARKQGTHGGPGGAGKTDRPRGGKPPRGPRENRGRPGPPREPRASAPASLIPSPPVAAAPLPPAPEAPAPEEGSFADMFELAEKSAPARRRWQVGEKVAAKILSIGGEVAFVEMGSGTADGMIAVVELMDADGVITYREGDIVDAVVVKGGERGVEISRGMASKGARERQVVYDAFKTGLPVEGLVKAVNKGGLEVEVAGQRAFCPTKQVDIRFVEDLTKLVGQRLSFRVQTADDRDIVLSRRALLEEERDQKLAATRARLEPGATFEGLVTNVRDFGAFVDIGGIEGLVHVSELAWERVGHPADKVKAGDTVTVQVLKIEPPEEKSGKKGGDKERISLSIKALTPAPERPPPSEGDASGKPAAQAMAQPRVGDVVDATVDKIEPFGIFVKFGNGRGLVPAAETGTPRGADLRKAFKVGDAMKCLIIELDDRGRLRLSKTQAEAAEERREAQAFMRESSKKGKQGFGTLGDLLAAKLKK